MTRLYLMRETDGLQACECGAMTSAASGGRSYDIGGGIAFACDYCAASSMASDYSQHAAADPHCTCNDCISDHAAREVKS